MSKLIIKLNLAIGIILIAELKLIQLTDNIASLLYKSRNISETLIVIVISISVIAQFILIATLIRILTSIICKEHNVNIDWRQCKDGTTSKSTNNIKHNKDEKIKFWD